MSIGFYLAYKGPLLLLLLRTNIENQRRKTLVVEKCDQTIDDSRGDLRFLGNWRNNMVTGNNWEQQQRMVLLMAAVI